MVLYKVTLANISAVYILIFVLTLKSIPSKPTASEQRRVCLYADCDISCARPQACICVKEIRKDNRTYRNYRSERLFIKD